MKKLFSTRYTDTAVSISLLALRIGMGGLMIPHGYKKLLNFAAKSSRFSDPFHIGGPASMSLVIFAEFFCAILVVLGLMTRLACIPLIIGMSVALFYAHNGQVFGDGEDAALFLFGFTAILFAGPGKISADRLIGK
jgi:putative oxidoreductase